MKAARSSGLAGDPDAHGLFRWQAMVHPLATLMKSSLSKLCLTREKKRHGLAPFAYLLLMEKIPARFIAQHSKWSLLLTVAIRTYIYILPGSYPSTSWQEN